MTDDELHAALTDGAAALGITLAPEVLSKLQQLIDELERWNRRINLTAIRDRHEMVAGHIMDSLAALPLLKGRTVADVGTGAGFPGLPLAITASERQFTLLDSNAKKLSFVRHIVVAQGLKNVEIVRSRLEDYAPGGGFDTVIARALAPTARLIELCGHLVGEDGVLLALKGRQVADELALIPRGWTFRVIELTVPGLPGHARSAIALTRRGAAS